MMIPTPTAKPLAPTTPIPQSPEGAWMVTPTATEAPMQLTLPLPHSDRGPLVVKPCADLYYPVLKAEKMVPSQWGPAWEATLTAGEFYRCLEPAPRFPDTVPLLWLGIASYFSIWGLLLPYWLSSFSAATWAQN